MTCLNQSPRIWIRVRDRSRLELRLVSRDDTYTTDIKFCRNAKGPDEVVESWGRGEVMAGGKAEALRSPHRYDLTVMVVFLGEDPIDVDVEARIIRPDRGPNGEERTHGKPFCERLRGRKGDVRESIISVFTRRSE